MGCQLPGHDEGTAAVLRLFEDLAAQSQAFYWREEWRKLGSTSMEDFLVGFWEGFFLDDRDANNLAVKELLDS